MAKQIKRRYSEIKVVFRKICEQYKESDCTLASVCEANNVSVRTFNVWTHKYSALAELYKKTKEEIATIHKPEILIEKVQNSLVKKALGYTADETTYQEIIIGKEVKTVKKVTKKHIPASDTAIIFFLVNKDPDNWKRHDREEQGDINVNITQKTESELQELRAKILNEDDQMPE